MRIIHPSRARTNPSRDQAMLQQGYLRVRVIADACKMSDKTVYRWLDKGVIQYENVGGIRYVKAVSFTKEVLGPVSRKIFWESIHKLYGKEAVTKLKDQPQNDHRGQ